MLEVAYISTNDLIPYINNSRTHEHEQVSQVAASIQEFGFTNPVLIDEHNGIIAGHGRIMAAQLLKMEEVPTITLAGLSEAQKKAYIIADNKLALNAGWNDELLALEITDLKDMEFDLSLLGFDDQELAALLDEDPGSVVTPGSLATEFGIAPFSVWDTRAGAWQSRKRTWKALIGDNGESREETLFKTKGTEVGDKMFAIHNGVSVLDPVMSEIIVNWFGTKDGLAFDPFAGDSVFGFVAGTYGMGFEGIELRQEQCDLNQKRVDDAGLPCKYYCDSGENMDTYIKDETVDLVFSCPPYADLEVYSDDPLDLSTMSHDDFFLVYKRILQNTYTKLKDNRFAVIVMGEVRGKDGSYIGTIPKTIRIMEEAGYTYYNEIVLINPEGTLPLRAGKAIRASRKVGKMHQNVLVFLKGDAKQAVADLGDINMDIDESEQEEPEE